MLFIAASIPATVIYANTLDTMVPSDSQPNTLYSKYGVSHYAFQTVSKDHHFWQVGAAAKDGVVNAFDQLLSMGFLISVILTRFFTFLAREAFTFSFMDTLIDSVAVIIQKVTGVSSGVITTGGFFESLGGIAVMVTATYILWLMVRTRFLDGLQQSLSFLIALVVCIAFFSQAGPFLKTANNMVTSVGDTMFKGLALATGLDTDAQDGVTVISEQVWLELVIRPYTMLQFDSYEIATKDPDLFDKVLSSKPFSEDRDAALSLALEKYPGVGEARSAEQMIIILVYFIFSIFILGFFCFWAVGTIFLRMKILIHAAVMSITLLASLLPGREAGISVLRSQFIKLIGLSVTTTMTMFFLDLSLVMGHLTYDVVAVKGGKGWFTGLLLEAVMIFVIFKYRNEISSVFTKATGVIPPMAKTKSTVMDALHRNVTRSLYNTATNKVSGFFNNKEREGVPGTFNPNSLSKSNSSVNDATNSSMMLRYQREKQAAEEIASESGENVQYTPYVQRVNENLRNGTKNPFRGMDKEWKEEKNRLKDIQDDGGDMRKAVLTHGVHEGMNDQEVAATVYGNENAIRQAASHMVNRPKEAVKQMERVNSLNKNNKLQTSVNDFCMIQLFERYKVEYKRAIDTSQATGEPVQHSDFVKNMDSRFKIAGLNTTQKVNETMMHRNSRISIAPVFDEMPEFNEYKMKLLQANEALRKIAPPAVGIYIPEPDVHFAAPVSTDFLLAQMPKLPDGSITSQMSDRKVTMEQVIDPSNTRKVITLPDSYFTKQPVQGNTVEKQTKVTPLYKSIPISNESFQASIPELPGADIASQMVDRKRTLQKQIQDSLGNAVTIQSEQDKIILTAPAYTVGPVNQASVHSKLPKLPDSSVSRVLTDRQEVRRTVIERTLNSGLEQKEQENPILKRRQVTQQMELKRLYTSVSQADSNLSGDIVHVIPKQLKAKYRVNVSSSVEGGLKTPVALMNQSTPTTQNLLQVVQVKRRFGTKVEVGRISMKPSELIGRVGQAKVALSPLQGNSGVTNQSVEQSLMNKVNIKRTAGTQVNMSQVTIKNPELKAKMDNGKAALAPFQSTSKTTQQSVQQNTLNKVNVNRSNGTQVTARNEINQHSGAGMEPVKSTMLPLQSTIRVSQQSVEQRSLNKVNIKRNKDIQIDMNKVNIKNPDLKASLTQGKATILPLQSTSNVSHQSLSQRKVHKVRVDQRNGIQVDIRKQEQNTNTKIPEVDSLPKVTSSNQTVEQKVVQQVKVNRKVVPNIEIKTVNINNPQLKTKMEEAKTALNRSGKAEDLKIQINTEQVQKVAMEVKQKISPDISSGLEDELRHLKTMQRARKTAPVSKATENLSQSVQQKVITARQVPKQQPGAPS